MARDDTPDAVGTALELRDAELLDSATMSADVLRAVARRWRFRMQAGRLGTHSLAETRELVRRLERAADVIEGSAGAPAAAALDEDTDRFRFLVDSVTDYAIFMLDPDGNITSWNAGAERIMGCRAEEVLGRHFSTFYPVEELDTGKPQRELDIAAREGRFTEEGWRVKKNGQRFWAHVTLTAVRDAQGKLRGYAKVTRDVTDVREASEALRQSESRLRLMVDVVRDYAIYMLDENGRVASWNAGAERITGYTAQEIIGTHFSVFYPAEARASGHPDEELRRALADGRYEEEALRVRKDGTTFWANVVIAPLFERSGKHIGFTKVTRDFTERRRAEETLRQSEERFRLLVDGVRDYAIFLLDKEGYVSTWNLGAARIKQYAAHEIIGKHFSIFYPESEVQRGHPQYELERACAEGAYGEEGWRVRKDGSLIWANVLITALHDDSGALIGFAKVTRDLTERRQIEEAARKAAEDAAAERARAEEAQNAVRARDEFITIAGHELRTPLTALQLKVDGVRAAFDAAGAGGAALDVDKLGRRLDDARAQIKRFGALVERLLDVSRAVRGTITLQPAEVDLVALVGRVVAELLEAARSAGCELRVEAPPSLVCRCDEARIEQVLVNLLTNAVKYGAGKPVDVRISREEARAGGTDAARVVIEDRGIGIATDAQERIFGRFERAVSAQNYGGLGLGLYIARNIVDAHGGRIEVASAPGNGAVFTVTLPLGGPP